jgi:hypothetical protein
MAGAKSELTRRRRSSDWRAATTVLTDSSGRTAVSFVAAGLARHEN